mgnify:FL=1
MQEATEEFGKMLRWSEQPKDAEQAEKTIFRGIAVQGYYVGKRDAVGKNASTVYELMLANGEKVAFWGSGLLDGKFAEIPLNCEVRVTCLGTQQPKTPAGRAYLGFKVEFDKDSKRPANLVEAAPSTVGAPVATAPATPVAPAVAPQGTAGEGF